MAVALSTSAICAFAGEKFVTQKGDKLWHKGKEYRAIGVNTINIHLSYARKWFHDNIYTSDGEDPKGMMINALDDTQKSGFKFIRFFAHPGYPKTMDKFYLKDKKAYWRNMDKVVEECRKRDLKLVPSLNMINVFTTYYGEPHQAILDPKSKAYKATYKYIEEFVTRYKDDPTILIWELANETMNKADVNMAGRKVNKGIFTRGKAPREKQVIEDSLSYDQIVRIYKKMATFIRNIDKNHLITSGDSHTRPECTSRRETFPNFKYCYDTLQKWIANNINSQPAPLNVYSLHMYGTTGTGERGWIKKSAKLKNNLELFKKTILAMRKSGRPVFIGEYGQNWKAGKNNDPQEVLDMMKMFDKTGVSLMCFWTWHFKWQAKTYNTTSKSQPKIVEFVKEFNKRNNKRAYAILKYRRGKHE